MKENTVKIKVEVEVEVEEDWIEFLTKYSDIFSYDYCGYWMCGMEKDKNGGGWLVYEKDDDECANDVVDHPEYPAVVKAWKKGEKLPDRWFRLDKEAAIKAYIEGCKKYGADWYESVGDACTYDVVIQLSLLGEVRYG